MSREEIEAMVRKIIKEFEPWLMEVLRQRDMESWGCPPDPENFKAKDWDDMLADMEHEGEW